MRLAPQDRRTYFITAATAGRRSLFQVERYAQLFVDTLQAYRSSRRFELYAYVVMPDHVHVLLTPAADVQLEKAVQFIKGGFSFRLKEKKEIWARGSFEKQVLTPEAFDAAVKYIHDNPVEAHLTDRAEAKVCVFVGGRGGRSGPGAAVAVPPGLKPRRFCALFS